MLIQYYIHTHNIYIFAIPSGKLTGCELERSTIFNGQIQYKPSPTQQTHDDGEEINIYIYIRCDIAMVLVKNLALTWKCLDEFLTQKMA